MARLATINTSGGADLVPITFALLEPDAGGDVLVTAVDHKPKRTQRLTRLANIAREPEVTVLVDDYDDDWSRLWWVRLRGLATVLDPGSVGYAEAVGALVTKYPQYRDQRPSGPVIRLRIDRWTTWSAGPTPAAG